MARRRGERKDQLRSCGDFAARATWRSESNVPAAPRLQIDLQKPLEGVRRSAVAQTGVEFDGSNDETEIIARGLQEKNVHGQKKNVTPIPKSSSH